MRYAPEHNETTRTRIVEGASRLFREHGVAAVGLAKVMAEAELTVGTFYTHFSSKEALLQEVLVHAQRARDAALEQTVREGHLELMVRTYLSPAHRDDVGGGCIVAALGAEVARHPRETRDTLIAGLAPSLELLQRLLERDAASPRPPRSALGAGAPGGPLLEPEHDGCRSRRADTIALFGLLSGTLQLARATADVATSDEILEAGVRAALLLARSLVDDASAR